MKSRKYVPGILVDGRGLRGPKGDKGDAGFVISEITSYITNLTDYGRLTHTHGNVLGFGITATSASNGLTLSVGNYLTTAAVSNHSHTDVVTGVALSGHTHGSIYITGGTGTDISYSSASNGLTISMPPYLTTAAETWHSHSNLYIPLSYSTSYQSTGNYLTTAANSTHSHGPATALGNITVGSSSNGAVFSVSEGIKQIVLGGNTLGTAGTLSTGSVLLVAAGALTFSQDGNTITFLGGAGGTKGDVSGFSSGSTNAGTTIAGTLDTNGLSIVYPRFLTTARSSNDAIGLNTAITGGSMTGNSSGLSINLPAYLTTARRSTDAIGLATAVTNASMTADSRGISLNIPDYLTTARRSTDGIGLATAQTNVTWTVDSRGISLDAVGYLGTGTAITGGLMTADSRGISVDVAAAVGMGLVTAITGGAMTANTDGLSIDLSPAVGVGLGTTIATTSGAILKITANTDGLNISHPDWLTTAMVSAAGSNFIGLNTAVTGGSMTADSRGISVNIPNGGVQIAGSAASTVTGGVVQFGNANGISFSLDGSTMKASWQSTNYVLTALSSAFQHTSANSLFSQTYQLTANNSLSLGNTYSTHTHGSIFTSSITGSVLTNSSGSSGLTLGIPAYVTAAGAHTHTDLAYRTHIHGSGPSITGPVGITSNSSAWSISMPSFITTAALSNHSHTIALYKTNIEATSDSGNLSLSVPVGSVYFSNVASNNITFGSVTSGSSTTITARAGGGTGGGGGGGIAMQITGNTAGSLVYITSGTLTLGGSNGITLSQTGNRVDVFGEQGSVYFSGGSNVTWGSSLSGIHTTIMLTAGGGGGNMGTNISTSGAITATGNTAGLSITVPPLGYLYFANIAGFSFVSTVNSVSTTIGLSTE